MIYFRYAIFLLTGIVCFNNGNDIRNKSNRTPAKSYYSLNNSGTINNGFSDKNHVIKGKVWISPHGKSVSSTQKIVLSFNRKMLPDVTDFFTITRNSWSNGPIVISKKGWRDYPSKGEKVTGNWIKTNDTTYIFTPEKPYSKGSMIAISISNRIRDAGGNIMHLSRYLYSFLVDNGTHYKYEEKYLPKFRIVNNGTHVIPLRMVIPKTNKPHPVMFWVHGGGWNGGTPGKSWAPEPEQGKYLAEHLGIMSVGIAYRCKGSNGTFAEAMDDINSAVRFILNHAEKYHIDTTKIGFYGGSAGTPLASLEAQRVPGTKCFIGYNGIYNFVVNPGSKFGYGNAYRQRDPSARANSAIFNLRNPPPATLLLLGTNDHIINPLQSFLFARAVRKAGGTATVLLYKEQPHAFFNVGRTMEIPTLYKVKGFLKNIFRLN